MLRVSLETFWDVLYIHSFLIIVELVNGKRVGLILCLVLVENGAIYALDATISQILNTRLCVIPVLSLVMTICTLEH